MILPALPSIRRRSLPDLLALVRAARRSPSPESVLVTVVLASVAVITAWYLLLPADTETQRAVSDVWTPFVDLGAAWLLTRAAARHSSRRVRLAWSLLAAAMISYAVGDAVWNGFDLSGADLPFPSLADIAYMAFYPITAAGLLLFPAAALGRREATRLVIDAGIVVLGGGMLVWQSLLRPALMNEPDLATGILALGYPVGDLALLAGVASIALRRASRLDTRALSALVAGLMFMFVADVGYGELALTNAASPHWTDVVYLASSAAIALAGYLQARAPELADEDEARPLSRWFLLLPYVGLAAGFGVLLAASEGNVNEPVGDLLYGAIGLTILVVVRQELVQRENSRLVAESARRATEARFRSLEADARDAILLVEPDGVVAFASPNVERVLGLPDAVVLGQPAVRLAHADDVAPLQRLIADCAAGRPTQPLEWRLWGQDGVWRQVETIAANLLDEADIGKIVLTTHDVRERRALKHELAQASLHDLVTGLPNRALFRDRVDRALTRARRTGEATAVLTLDVDGFKRLNDSLGHALGDVILKEVGARVSATIRAADTCARVGGDEFAVLLDGGATVEAASALAERIRGALGEPLSLAGTTIQLTASVGIAVTGEGVEAADPRALVRDADIALSAAREQGRDRAVVFEPSMRMDLEGNFELEADLRRAVGTDQLTLEFQPIIELATMELAGAEALIRWDHPTRGRLGPNVFIPLAEREGLIGEIGTWVLSRACREAARWARVAPGAVPRVAVNLSAPQVADPHLPWVIQSALAQAGAEPGWLDLEVTESLLVSDTAATLERLHGLRAMGIEISVDDFGTGFSSLTYLQRFPVNNIKIDRSFVTPLDEPDQGPGIAGAIVEIGRALGMATIAEGIETEAQLERVRAMGCTYGQGYLLGRPMSADAMVERVRGRRA